MTGSLLSAHYDYWLVALSIAIAVCASYTALDLAARMTYAEGRSRAYWLCGGATIMGVGIWSMHYVGMLALSLPVPVFYEIPTVLFSAACAILASAVALLVVSRREMKTLDLMAGGAVMGVGIAGMHYSGMAAMRLTAHCSYNGWTVALSLLIAVVVSVTALRIAFRLRNQTGQPIWLRLAASVVMGLAIAAMHYTGMAAMSFHLSGAPVSLTHSVAVSQLGIALLSSVTFLVLGLAVVGALLGRNFSEQKSMLAARKERWDLLMRQDGVFDADLITGKAFYSPRWLEIIGYLPGELPGTMDTWTERIHPDERMRVQAELNSYLQGRDGQLLLEYRLRHRDGMWRWIFTRGQAVWESGGRPVRILGTAIDISLRKEAEAKLKAGEERFGAFMQNAPTVNFIKDEEGRVVYTNAIFDKKFQLTPGEWLGRSVDEIFPAKLAGEIRAFDLAVLASKIPMETVEVMPMRDGSVVHFLSTKFSFNDATGRRVLGGTALDITDRVKAEQLVQESEARYRELFEENPLPAWVYCKADLRVLEVNAAAIAHYGWTRDEFLDLSLYAIRMEDEVAALEAELDACSLLHKKTRPWRHRRKDGSRIWVELVSHNVVSAHVPARLIMVHDVTARITSEAEVKLAYEKLDSLIQERTSELQSSEARWRGLIEATPQFIWATTPEGAGTYFNPQMLNYTGMTFSQMAGWGWADILHSDDRERTQTGWEEATRTLQSYTIEYRMRSREGAYRWFLGRGVPIRDESGRVTQWVGICTDIDDNKRSEERLEAAVQMRTMELAEARDRAELATRSKALFLAAMSHEIRTPMNGIIGMTALMLDTPLNSEQGCYLETIRSSGQALLGIINDVLDFSKIEAGKLELETTPFDLQTVIEEATELVASTAAKKKLELTFAIDEQTPLDLLGDPGRLRQILLNLLSNAVKFTERGSVTLSVSREALQGEHHVVRFAVKDTGIGITAVQQRGLFQAFSQADASTTRKFGGTGLGLSIVKRLVEMMGGTIGVDSQVRAGSTFWFKICVAGADVTQTPDLQGKCLLVAGGLAESKRRYLQRSGLAVKEYAPGFAALAGGAPSRQDYGCPIDVLLVDAADISHPKDLEKSRLPPAFAKVPVLVMGTSNDWSEGKECAALATTRFIAKPIRRPALLHAIELALCDRSPVVAPQATFAAKLEVRVLVAEDHIVNQMIVRMLLEKLGCHIDMVENGALACAAFERNTYDAVFMDCHMPEMDGFEATRLIRAMEGGKTRTPVIALTAAVLEEERKLCYAAGMDDFLTKPISYAALQATLNKWVHAADLQEA